ncbi:unnamed protein product [Ectocarpus sp. 13 AM-2016]
MSHCTSILSLNVYFRPQVSIASFSSCASCAFLRPPASRQERLLRPTHHQPPHQTRPRRFVPPQPRQQERQPLRLPYLPLCLSVSAPSAAPNLFHPFFSSPSPHDHSCYLLPRCHRRPRRRRPRHRLGRIPHRSRVNPPHLRPARRTRFHPQKRLLVDRWPRAVSSWASRHFLPSPPAGETRR